MGNILDYLSWRGDIPFSVSPFNEVDNYIISKIGCPDYTGIVPEDGRGIGISETVDKYFTLHPYTEKGLGALASTNILRAIMELPKCERFSSLILTGYRKLFDAENTEQFSALTVILPDGNVCVTFRGTDDTLVAWKENFNMAVMEQIPAQHDALEYLKWAATTYPGPLMVCGHSKGGNLAVYASAMVSDEIRKRIVRVYNNDGPGFHPDFYASPGYLSLSSRIVTILPYYSMVGILMRQCSDPVIAKCSKPGPASHDGFIWEVDRDHFIRLPELSRSSAALQSALERMVEEQSPEFLQEFINEFFSVLSSSGAETVSDLTVHVLKNAIAMASTLKEEKSVRSFALQTLELMVKDYELPVHELHHIRHFPVRR